MSSKRHLLRAHELGHALGYNHVQSRISIMQHTYRSSRPRAHELSI